MSGQGIGGSLQRQQSRTSADAVRFRSVCSCATAEEKRTDARSCPTGLTGGRLAPTDRPPPSAPGVDRVATHDSASAPQRRYPGLIFAAKTTASGLLALLIAFTFNLDQPQWTLLTVFIVSQPRQDGLVFAKSFYRIVGTVVGAVMALVFVAAAAQERVVFLGALAFWVGLCAFGSQYAQGWANYAFVLSGYTVAIVGIPGALDPSNAFYIAVARVTEVSLGITVTATISRLFLPDSFAATLRQAIASARTGPTDYALAVLRSDGTMAGRIGLLKQAAAIDASRRFAIFTDREIRRARYAIACLCGALVDVAASAQCLGSGVHELRKSGHIDADLRRGAADFGHVMAWRAGGIDGPLLRERLATKSIRLRSAFRPAASRSVREHARTLATLDRLSRFLDAVCSFAEANSALNAGRHSVSSCFELTSPNDLRSAVCVALRSILAVVISSSFWILADWPHGSSATVLATIATARLATMSHQVPLAIAAALIFSFATVPAFLLIDVALPLASGFPAFAIVVAPALFACALLMAREKTMVIGYMAGLLFASVGGFQNRMVYDPVGLLNTAIAAVFACVLALVLWSVVFPETPAAVRRRFVRAAERALAPLVAAQPVALAEFESVMGGALVRFCGDFVATGEQCDVCLQAGLTVLGASRELVLLSESARVHLLAGTARLKSEVAADIARCLSELRRNPVQVPAVLTATRDLVRHQNELALRKAEMDHPYARQQREAVHVG